MNYCLICDQEILLETSWTNVIFPSKERKLCTVCERKLIFIPEVKCQKCSKAYQEEYCDDCKRWEKHYKGKDPLQFNLSLFQYNEFLKDIISTWKYRGDYVIVEAFKPLFVEYFNRHFSEIADPLLVPIPLSRERAKERGFNQALQLASFLPGRLADLLIRKTSEKQAKKSRLERIYGDNPFQLKSKSAIKKPIILVDDIYTTGSTLRQAARLLLASNCSQVYSYTLIRG